MKVLILEAEERRVRSLPRPTEMLLEKALNPAFRYEILPPSGHVVSQLLVYLPVNGTFMSGTFLLLSVKICLA